MTPIRGDTKTRWRKILAHHTPHVTRWLPHVPRVCGYGAWCGILFLSVLARADSITTKDESLKDIRITRVYGGRVFVRVGDEVKKIPLAQISRVEMTEIPELSAAEDAYAKEDWLRAGPLFTQVGRNTSKVAQGIARARMIRIQDACGQWGDAIKNFLSVYAENPGEDTWALRPMHLPDESSVMLSQSAAMIEARMREEKFQTVTAQQHMKLLLVDIYLQMSDPRAAKLARELQNHVAGGAVAQPAQTSAAATQITTQSEESTSQPAAKADEVNVIARQVDDFAANKKWARALAILDDAIEKSQGSNAAQLAVMRADVLMGEGKTDDALLAYLRVPSMNDSGSWGGAALLKAADLQNKMGRTDAAQRLYQEAAEKYADTVWGKKARDMIR